MIDVYLSMHEIKLTLEMIENRLQIDHLTKLQKTQTERFKRKLTANLDKLIEQQKLIVESNEENEDDESLDRDLFNGDQSIFDCANEHKERNE